MVEKDKYEALAICIRSGQVDQSEVPKIMNDDPDFAKWYKEKFLDKINDRYH